jgi:hypothetical protein
MDNRAQASKIVELRAQIASLDLGEPTPTAFVNGPVTAHSCPACGVGAGNHTHDCPNATKGAA